jgi:tetratricopeptide (TPR) repeat protein
MAKPDIPFLDWAFDWLNRDPAIGLQVDRKVLLTFFGFVLQQFPGTVIPDEARREELRRLARLAKRTLGEPDPEVMLAYARVALVRKLGQFDEALALAERGYSAHPGYHLASATAEVYKGKDDEENWLKWQQIALGHDPGNVPTRLDVADYYLDRDQYREAARWYQEALDCEPEHPWATPSLYAARYFAGNQDALAQLQAYAAAHPDNERAAFLTRRGTPYIGYLPAPSEATLGILRHFTELAEKPDTRPGGLARVTLSALEALSSRLACRLGATALGFDPEIPFEITAIQQPDPRLPRRPVRYQVWKYKEEKKLLGRKHLTTEPIAAVPEPLAEIAAAVAGIASEEFDRSRWFVAAGELVQRIRPRAEDLLGVMAHPPDPPKGAPAALWIQRIQVAAALALANLDPDVPWPQSRRKQILFDLLLGPMDWIVDASVIALTALAQTEPTIVGDVSPLFLELLHDQPRPGYVCYVPPVVYCFQQLPNLPQDLKVSLAEYQRQMESQQAEAEQE